MKTGISKKVASNEKRYRDFNKRFVDSLWVIDAETLEVIFISESKKKLRGYRAEEVIGSHIREIVTDDSYQRAMDVMKKARQEYEQGKDPAYRLEIECYHKNNSTTWFEITAKFVKEDGEPLQIVGISRDITDRKIAEMNKEHLLKMYKEALEEQKRLRSEIKLLEQLLPICSGCRRIRDEKDNWWPLEAYVREKTGSQFTHSICPDCTKVYYPDIENEEDASFVAKSG